MWPLCHACALTRCGTRRYAFSFLPDASGAEKILAKGGNTGDAIYDFFIGR